MGGFASEGIGARWKMIFFFLIQDGSARKKEVQPRGLKMKHQGSIIGYDTRMYNFPFPRWPPPLNNGALKLVLSAAYAQR